MVHRMLLIEPGCSSGQLSLERFFTPDGGFQCEHVLWESVDALGRSGPMPHVVVAVSSPDPRECLDWLAENPFPVSTLIVLPLHAAEGGQGTIIPVADDVLFSPVNEHELRFRVNRLLKTPLDDEQIRQKLKRELGLFQLVGDEPCFRRVIDSIPGIARSGAPVLLHGETGTGKELCAQAIHNLSCRQAGPLIPVECGAIPEQLLENELFGHSRGAFTDAHAAQKGLVAMAGGGTLFLDEVDSLPLAAQAKILRFLQEGTYRPLGSETFARADVRVVAATNRDLARCVRDGQFRADLYFRLNVLPLELPPLRRRPGDIPRLAEHFLARIRESEGIQKEFSPAAMRVLRAYPWPGNVRELFNVVQRAVAFSPGRSILPASLALPVTEQVQDAETVECSFRDARSLVVKDFEKAYLLDMLRKHDGNVTRAALACGKDRRVFGRLLRKHNIDRTAL